MGIETAYAQFPMVGGAVSEGCHDFQRIKHGTASMNIKGKSTAMQVCSAESVGTFVLGRGGLQNRAANRRGDELNGIGESANPIRVEPAGESWQLSWLSRCKFHVFQPCFHAARRKVHASERYLRVVIAVPIFPWVNGGTNLQITIYFCESTVSLARHPGLPSANWVLRWDPAPCPVLVWSARCNGCEAFSIKSRGQD